MLDTVEKRFASIAPAGDFCSLRVLKSRYEYITVRQDILQPVATGDDLGAMLTVAADGGLGYAATSDLSEAGLRSALAAARGWAERTRGRSVTDFSALYRQRQAVKGEYATPVQRPWETLSLGEKIELVKRECARLKLSGSLADLIVYWETSLGCVQEESLIVDNQGSRIHQRLTHLVPYMAAVANRGSETQERTLGGRGLCRQGGLEMLDKLGFYQAAPRVAAEALELLDAPDCPTGKMDLLLAPDQMILQIHESIGHPLELDRILGDERNYAGTSFVTLDMLGKYPYGSKLLNITFDPGRPEEFASYGFDDEGTPARREFIIKEGILQRPLGGATSQARAGVPGVANARAHGWNRPPIDRMANLNLEPGTSDFQEMVKAVKRGVYMETNCSWSIDDSRNKFQFGCERGQRIEDGQLKGVVKKCNYRGISATFWRNLKMVGNQSCYDVMGTPYCGKGEPNQMVRVGHATPACLFADVDVFGGAS